jgi:hypothetical protein
MSSPPTPISAARAPGCAPPEAAARVVVLADGGAMAAAGHAAQVLRADGHDLVAVPVDGVVSLDGVDGVLALGGPPVAALARAQAPAGAYVRSQELAGHDPATWVALALRAARATAVAVAPPGIGVCG